MLTKNVPFVNIQIESVRDVFLPRQRTPRPAEFSAAGRIHGEFFVLQLTKTVL